MVENRNVGLSHELLRNIVEVIVRRAHPVKILLFGSRARGSYTSTSDIDIAVDCGGDDFIVQAMEEEIRTLLKLDIVHLHRLNKQLRDEIAAEGIVLYEEKK
jgi:predicted nucleotidyltransferase